METTSLTFVLAVSGCDPFDGTYRVSPTDKPFTTGELSIIKTVSGVRSQEIQEAIVAGDTDVIVALAVIGIVRAGKALRQQARQIADMLWDTAGSLEFSWEGDDSPPEEAAPAPPSDAANESSPSDSGSDSRTTTASPA